jgi:polysaccharide biosynthesis protein PslH
VKILVLLSRVPYPLEKGDKLRAFNQIKRLSCEHDIHLIALNDTRLHPLALENLKPYCTSIKILNINKFTVLLGLLKSLFSRLPFHVGYFYSRGVKKAIQKTIKEVNPDVIYCQLIRMAEYANGIPYPKVLDYMDVFSKGAKRRASKSSFFLKPLLIMEYKRLLKYERKVFLSFETKTIISEQDRNYIPHSESSKIHIIPNGVDFNYFTPFEKEKKYDILFTGNMSYPPNVNSAIFLATEILPLVKEKFPGIRLLLAGASPSNSILRLRSKNVIVSGWVEDIRECYASAKVFVAPMQIGTGLQNKLLEAMSMRIPCITSSLANKALGAMENESILIAKSPVEYANLITELLKDPGKADLIAQKGYEFVRERFNWDTINRRLEEIIRETAKAGCLQD